MKIAILIAAGLLVLLLALVLLPKLIFSAIKPGLEARIARDCPEDQILYKDLTANFFGLESKGASQLRGNGALVLTNTELRFYQVAPERDLRIALADIERLSTVRSFLGKTVGVELLCVAFTVGGHTDTAAWYVVDLGAWMRCITERRAALQ